MIGVFRKIIAYSLCFMFCLSIDLFGKSCKDLLEILKNGKTQEAIDIIQEIVDFNCVDEYGDSPLVKAVELYSEYGHYDSGYEDIIRFLLEKGADVNAKIKGDFPDKGGTALTIASINGNDSIITLLLRYGAEIDAKTDNEETPLMCAASMGKISTVKLLLESGANPNLADREGKTAYFYALEEGYFEIADILAKAGADIVPHNRICKKILKTAKKKGYNPVTYKKDTK